MDTHKWCLTDEGRAFLMLFMASVFDETDVRDGEELKYLQFCANMANHVTETLWRGDTIYVTSDMLHLMMQAAEDMPDDVVADPKILMGQYGFALFEEPIVGTDVNGKTMTIHAITWECNPTSRSELEELGVETVPVSNPEGLPLMAIVIYFFTDPHDLSDDTNREMAEKGIPMPVLSLCHLYPMLEGGKMPTADSSGQVMVTAVVKLFWAMQLLSHQTIGEPVQMRPLRAQRRRLEREYPHEPQRMLTLITLRRKTVKHNEEPKKIEWSRRWVVRGHWRKQWYPKTKTYAYKYIYEYVKGPEDKPLVTGRRVFNFRR